MIAKSNRKPVLVLGILQDDSADETYIGVSATSILHDIDLVFDSGDLEKDWADAMAECEKREYDIALSSSVDEFDSINENCIRSQDAIGRVFFLAVP